MKKIDRLEYNPLNIDRLHEDYYRMGSRAENFMDGISWVAPEEPDLFRDLVHSPETFHVMREIFDILKAHPRWKFSEYGILRPDLAWRRTFPDPTESIEHVRRELHTRAYIFKKVLTRFGSDRFQVLLGNSPNPLECVLDPEIKLGGTRFSLMDGKDYDGKRRVELGMADISLTPPKTIIVNLMQDHNPAEQDKVVVDPETGERKKAKALASNRQGKIRKFMRKDRQVLKHPAASETAGVEELAAYCATEILSQAEALDPADDLSIFIPYPDFTDWGGAEWDDSSGSVYASSVITAKVISNALAQNPAYLAGVNRVMGSRDFQLRLRSGEIWRGLFTYAQDKLHENSSPIVPLGDNREPLDKVLAELVMTQIPEFLAPPDSWLREYGFFDGFSNFQEKGFKSRIELYRYVMNKLTSLTPQYLGTFSPYYVAFFDVSGREYFMEEGRRVLVSRIKDLPFASAVKIDTIRPGIT